MLEEKKSDKCEKKILPSIAYLHPGLDEQFIHLVDTYGLAIRAEKAPLRLVLAILEFRSSLLDTQWRQSSILSPQPGSLYAASRFPPRQTEYEGSIHEWEKGCARENGDVENDEYVQMYIFLTWKLSMMLRSSFSEEGNSSSLD